MEVTLSNKPTKPVAHIPIGVQYGAMSIPDSPRPVLARLLSYGELGKSEWCEVIYHNDTKWCSFAGSDTFSEAGTKVLSWIYVNEVL